MPLGNPNSGISNTSEFQSSALPFVTSSQAPLFSGTPLQIDFPKVTRFLTITNREPLAANGLRVAFTANGMTKSGNYYVIPGNASAVFELRVRSIFVAGDLTLAPFSLMAGLTTINAGDMPLLSGTLNDGSAGWPGVG
jgi:hypothetical protein